MQVWKGGAWRTIKSCQVFSGGSWRSIVQIKARSSGAWRIVANFTAPVSPPSGGGSGGGGGGGGSGGGGTITLSLSTTSLFASGSSSFLTTGNVTVTPSGGLAPYDYGWVFVSNDDLGSYVITAPNMATTAMREAGLPPMTAGNCSIHCVVTDSLGTTATSATVFVGFSNTSSH